MKRFVGIAAAPGVAAAPAFVYRPVEIVIHRRRGDDPADEWSRYQAARAAALQALAAVRQKAAAEVGEAEAAIFDAHQMIMCDPDLEAELRAEIEAGASAEAAVEAAFKRAGEMFAAMDEPLFRERGVDFADVGRRLLRLLLGIQDEALASLRTPVIVAARDLYPSDTAQLDKSMVRGFCTAGGGPLSHTAILARSLGLPAVVGVGQALLDIASGVRLIVDGTEGVVVAEV